MSGNEHASWNEEAELDQDKTICLQKNNNEGLLCMNGRHRNCLQHVTIATDVCRGDKIASAAH